MTKVLMTGAGAPGGPGILQSLRSDPSLSVLAADMDPFASGRFLTDRFFQVPPAKDPGFLSALKDICREQSVDVFLPLVTRELFLLAEHREAFAEFGTRILVSQREAMDQVNDKGRLYDALKENGLPCPEYYVTDTADELLERVAGFSDAGQACVIKPCVGNGSRGIRVISNDVNRFDLLFEHKPNSLYMSPTELELIVRGREIPQMVVAEYLPGEEVTVDTLNNNGAVELVLIRRRTKMSGGISVSGEFIRNEQIESLVRDISASIPGLHGPIGFQLKQNEQGFYHLIESNPRIQGTSVAAAGLGINLPVLAVQMAMGQPLDIAERRDGVCFTRYFQEVFYDS